MAYQTKQHRSYSIDTDFDRIPNVVDRIKEARGQAYSAFSGRPMSLCKSLERRGELRVKFEEPIYLWPADYEDGVATTTTKQPIISVTRDISPHGVGFNYDQRILTDHVIAEFDLFGAGTERLLVEVRWSTKAAPHAFEAGGLIVGIVKEAR